LKPTVFFGESKLHLRISVGKTLRFPNPSAFCKKIKQEVSCFQGVDKVDTLSRNQDFDLLRQRNKQTSSISLKALELAVFLVGNEFRLRILFGKRICFPSPSAASKSLCLQSASRRFPAFFVSLSEKRKSIDFIACMT